MKITISRGGSVNARLILVGGFNRPTVFKQQVDTKHARELGKGSVYRSGGEGPTADNLFVVATQGKDDDKRNSAKTTEYLLHDEHGMLDCLCKYK